MSRQNSFHHGRLEEADSMVFGQPETLDQNGWRRRREQEEYFVRETPKTGRRKSHHGKPVRKMNLETLKIGRRNSLPDVVGSPNNYIEQLQQEQSVGSFRVTLSEGLRKSAMEVTDLRSKVHELNKIIRDKEELILIKETEVERKQEEFKRLKARYEEKYKDRSKIDAARAEQRKAEHEAAQLATTLELTQKQLAHTKKQLEIKAGKLAELEKHLESKDENLEKVRGNISTQMDQYGELLDKFNKSTEKIKSLERFIEQQQRKPNPMDKEVERAKEQVDELQAAAKEQREIIVKLQLELAEGKEKFASMEETYVTREKYQEAALARIRAEMEHKNEVLASQQQKLQQTIALHQKEKRTLQGALEKSEATRLGLEKHMKKLETNTRAAKEAENTRTRLQKQVDEKTREIEDAKQLVALYKQKFEKNLGTEKQEMAELKQSNHALELSLQKLQQDHTKIVAELNDKVRSFEEDSKNEKRALDELLQSKQKLEQANKILEQQLQTVQLEQGKAIAAERKKLDQLKTDQETTLKTLKDEHHAAMEKASSENSRITKETKQTVEHMTKQIESLKEALEEQKQQFDAECSKCEELESRRDQLLHQVNEKVKLLETAQEESERIKSSLLANVDRERQIKDQRTKIENMEKQRQNLNQEIVAYRNEVTALKDENKQIVKLLENTKSSLRVYVDTRSQLEEENKRNRELVGELQKDLQALTSRIQNREVDESANHARQLAKLRSEMDTEIIKWKSKAASLEKQNQGNHQVMEELKRQVARKEQELGVFKETLEKATSDVSRLHSQISELQMQNHKDSTHRSSNNKNLSTVLTSVKEEMAAYRAMLNLKLLIKSADVTDATTYLEFARLKEKNMDEQLQILVYNVTACESHMSTCDPIGTRKQQQTRQRRMEKLEKSLRDTEQNRDDYLNTSRSNRDRLAELLKDAENKFARAQANARNLIADELGHTYTW